jgi:hypothetical protein
MRLIDMTATRATSFPPLTAVRLPDDLPTLKEMLLDALASLHESQRPPEPLQHQLALLLHRLKGPCTERVRPGQPTCSTRRPSGAAGELARECQHHELPGAARHCPGCGQLHQDIGVDHSEQLE